jgi:hypothetical protein
VGGKGGTGGTGAAGVTGTDGGTGDAGDVCAALIQDYNAAMSVAKQCNATFNTEQCTHEVDISLPCPGCKTWVNDTQPLDDVRQRWQQAGCDKVHRICPAITCIAPGKGSCVASNTGTDGMCVGLSVLPAPAAP